jgi:hypothetical protein
MTDSSFVDALEQLLTEERVRQFQEEGFIVLSDESCLPVAIASELRDEVRSTYTKGLMSPNQVQFLGSSKPITITKPNIFEFDMHNAARTHLKLLTNLFERDLKNLISMLNKKIAGLDLLGGEEVHEEFAAESSHPGAGNVGQSQNEKDEKKKAVKNVYDNITLKLQANCGGAFPWHYDNPGPPNKRKLTLAVYLTEGWTDGCGGEIELWPFLTQSPLSIAPALGTVVLFRSDLILHRVRPWTRKNCQGQGTSGSTNGTATEGLPNTRFCFTIWFDSGKVNADDEVNLRAKNLVESFIPTLLKSPVQRSLSRAVYDEEYRTALADCFGDGTTDYKVSIAIHEAHLKPLLQSAQVRQFIELLRQKKTDLLSEKGSIAAGGL